MGSLVLVIGVTVVVEVDCPVVPHVDEWRDLHVGAVVEDDGVVGARAALGAAVVGHQGADVEQVAAGAAFTVAVVAIHLVVEDVVADQVLASRGYGLRRAIGVHRHVGDQVGAAAIDIVYTVDAGDSGVGDVLHAGMEAYEVGSALEVEDVVVAEHEGVEAVEGKVGRGIRLEGVLFAVDVEVDAVEDHLVGALYGVETLDWLGADVAAVVAHDDEAVDVAALGRGAGADDVDSDVHLRLAARHRGLAGGVVAVAVDDDVGLAAEDAAGVEVGLVAGLAPVGAVVDRGVEVEGGGNQGVGDGLEAGDVVAVVAVNPHAGVAGPDRRVVDGDGADIDEHRAIDVALVAAAVDALAYMAADEVDDRRGAHGGMGALWVAGCRADVVADAVGEVLVEIGAVGAQALEGVAVVDSLAAAVEAEEHRAAVHVDLLDAVDELLAESAALDVVVRSRRGAEVATFHLGLATRATEDVATELAVVDGDADAAQVRVAAGVVGLHVGGDHVAVADKAHVAAAIDGAAEDAAVVDHVDAHAVGRGVEGGESRAGEESRVVVVAVAGAEDVLVDAAVDGEAGSVDKASEVVAAIDGVDDVGAARRLIAVEEARRRAADAGREAAEVDRRDGGLVGIVERDVGVAVHVARIAAAEKGTAVAAAHGRHLLDMDIGLAGHGAAMRAFHTIRVACEAGILVADLGDVALAAAKNHVVEAALGGVDDHLRDVASAREASTIDVAVHLHLAGDKHRRVGRIGTASGSTV